MEPLDEMLGKFREFLENRCYSIKEFAALPGVDRSPYTVREKWCNDGRINAQKSMTRAGPSQTWVISHKEYLRLKEQGLLPKDPNRNRRGPKRPAA